MKRFNLKEEYKKTFRFIRESKKFIFIAAGIFFAFAFAGFFLPVPEDIAEQLIAILQEIAEQTEGKTGFELMEYIFINNLQSSFFGMILGIGFGIISIILALTNGYLLGFVASLAVADSGFLILWRLLPHGIFELPAIFISLGMGLKLGMFVFQKDKSKTLSYCLINSIKCFLFVVFPLLIIAAIIEGALMLIP